MHQEYEPSRANYGISEIKTQVIWNQNCEVYEMILFANRSYLASIEAMELEHLKEQCSNNDYLVGSLKIRRYFRR